MAHRPEDDLKRARVYDGVAETYQRINVPRMFAEPARALVADLSPSAGARLLDAGAGTGVVARAARDAGARVVVADASVDMLLAARGTGLDLAANVLLPDLPFAAGSFDAVTSAFVLTHVDDPDAAAREMFRVLRPGGKIGLSAWSAGDDDALREWSRVMATFVDVARIEAATRVTLPNDARFSRPGSLADLLAGAGFHDIVAREHEIVCDIPVAEYVESRVVCAAGRALQTLLPAAEFSRFRAAVVDALRARFPDGIRFQRGYHTAVAVRPA